MMKIAKILVAVAVVGFCGHGCNTDEAEYLEGSSSSSGSSSTVKEEDDGTGNDVEKATFTKTITITYDGSSVTIDGEADSVSIATSGAQVTITSKASEMEYILKGSTTNGNLKVYSDYKYKLTLSDVSITSTTSSAINNQCSKKFYVYLEEGTTNTLEDGSSYNTSADEDEKACLFSEGQIIFCGSGTLNVTGNYKHAICSDDYVAITQSAVINVLGSVSDGIHANDYVSVGGGTTTVTTTGSDGIDVEEGYFIITDGTVTASTSATASKAVKAAGNIYINGGTMTLTTTGGAEYDSSSRDYSSASCLKSDSSIYVNAGVVTATSSGTGGKGIKADYDFEVNGGSVYATAKGTSKTNYYSAKGIKADQLITINDGYVYAYSGSHEGMESKGEIHINGGVVEVTAYDDAINASSHLYITDGYVYARSSDNDGLDSNGNLYIQGGTVVAYGTSDPECGIDANEEGGYSLRITGGTVIGIGGGTSYPTSVTGSQPVVVFTGSVANVGLSDSSGNLIVAWDYSSYATSYVSSNKSTSLMAGFGGMNTPGGGSSGHGGSSSSSGSWTYIISSPNLTKGSSYTAAVGVTISNASDVFHGLTTSATISGGSSSKSVKASVTGK